RSTMAYRLLARLAATVPSLFDLTRSLALLASKLPDVSPTCPQTGGRDPRAPKNAVFYWRAPKSAIKARKYGYFLTARDVVLQIVLQKFRARPPIKYWA